MNNVENLDTLLEYLQQEQENYFSDTNNLEQPLMDDYSYKQAKEEFDRVLGISADKLELVSVLSGKDYYFEYPNGDKMCIVIILFKVLNYIGNIQVSDNESKQLKFFALNDLPNMESRANAIIDKILDGSLKIN